MKRILNLNSCGLKSLLVIGVFLVVVPGISYAGSSLLGRSNPTAQVLLTLAKASALAGVILLAAFVTLLVFEQVQDKIIYRQYLKNRGKKGLIADNLYECQYCGCRKVREFDMICPVCGKSLE